MFFKFKKQINKIVRNRRSIFVVLVVLLGTLFLSSCTFIELRMYPPVPEKNEGEEAVPPLFVWVDETHLGENLAFHRPYLFRERPLANRYGSLVPILKREVFRNPRRYPLVHSGFIREVRIQTFHLESVDSCWTNRVSLELRVEILEEYRKRGIKYRDEIVSHVTDCFLIGSSVTLIPLLWYIPYLGFRGNREDQLNQLGRNAILVILNALREKE